MLDRRTFLQRIVATGVLIPNLTYAQRPMGGVKENQKPFRFYNAHVLDSKGQLRSNWGGEVIDGELHLSKSISDGIDLKERWIVPNFIDAGCTVGLYEVGLESGTHDDSEQEKSELPLLEAVDGYNPLSEVIPTVRANGIGTVLLHPSIDRLVSGSMSVVNLAGMTRSEVLFEQQVGLCIGLGGAGKGHRGPSTRMGIAFRLREILSEIKPPPEKKQKWWNKEELLEELPARTEEEIWTRVAARKIPVIFSAKRADDIEFALSLIENFEISGMIMGGAEAWIHARRLSELKVPVLLGPVTVQPSSFEHVHARYDNAKILHDAGVVIAFRSGQNHNSRQLPSEVAVAVANGLSFEAAIQALCYNATTIFPMHKPFLFEKPESTRANFFICDGDPLQPRNHIHRMWIDGQESDLRTRQTDLYEKYRELSK